MANYVLAVVGSMYSFAQKRGLVPEGFNPASRIEKYPEQARERFLTSDELVRLGDSPRSRDDRHRVGSGREQTDGQARAEGKEPPNGFRALPGCRASITAPDGMSASRSPASEMGIHRLRARHDLSSRFEDGRSLLVLNAPALAVLDTLPRLGSYVVLGEDPEKPRHDLKKVWAAVTRRAGLEGVRIHDLRHTFASVGAGGGMGLPIVGKLLGHSQAATTARYAHLDNDPLRRASDRIAGNYPRRLSIANLKHLSCR